MPAERVERLSILVPIGIIVAIAIVCVFIAVLGAAQRADEVSLDAERRLISRALTNHSQRVLRELETVVMSDAAYRKLRIDFDMDWVKVYADQRLQSWYGHDLVFVVDPSDRLLYASLGGRGSDPSWFNSVRPDLMPMWLRAWSRVPFVDRYAHPWMWSRGGFEVVPPSAGGD